jgi:hypothetical protein
MNWLLIFAIYCLVQVLVIAYFVDKAMKNKEGWDD